MAGVEYSKHWFNRIPSALFEWGDFFSALRHELASLIDSSYVGNATLYLPEHQTSQCGWHQDERETCQLSFTFFDDSMHVEWASETLGFDQYTVNQDLSWTYDSEDSGRILVLTDEFKSWVQDQDTQAGMAAVLAIAVAKAWIGNPPGQNSGMTIELSQLWAD
jgi:hypothetical protein